MNKADAKKLVQVVLGKQQTPNFGLEEEGRVLPIKTMLERLTQLSEIDFGMYAWSREPLERKFDKEQKTDYILAATRCGKEEAIHLKHEYQTDDPTILAKKMGLNVSMPDIPVGGGHVIFAQYVEPNEVTIFMDAVRKAETLVADSSLGELLEQVDICRLLLAHEIFHAVEFNDEDSIYTKTEKVELWRKPFSNKSRLICLGEIAGMAFAKELLGISFSPYVMDVLLIYGYHEVAGTALYEEIMEISGEMVSGEEIIDAD